MSRRILKILNLVAAFSFAVLAFGVSGCWQQYSNPAPSNYQQFSSMPQPQEYPGVRDLMDAPSTDPALNPIRNDLRP